jgi:hypothetical protein
VLFWCPQWHSSHALFVAVQGSIEERTMELAATAADRLQRERAVRCLAELGLTYFVTLLEILLELCLQLLLISYLP